MTCSLLKTYPTTTGKIILLVYTHCKDSESTYGIHLNNVEKQLKELFRSCHELQLVYLMTLEKHFVFDIIKNEDQSILLEALNINLRIGEIVQALDVKTMAEQWKANIAICEKYSSCFIDKDIYNNCSELLAAMIEANIKTALENDKQEKIVLRSLKVASFTIKILLKVSNLFKHGSKNNYECLLHMFINTFMCDNSILEGILNKSSQLISQMDLLILNTTQSLLSQLLLDERFFNCILQCDIRNVKGDNLLGYILLLISTIKAILQNNEDYKSTLSKPRLIECVLNTVRFSHVFFNMGLRFKLKEDTESCGLEQHLLTHVVALCMTLSPEEFAAVERRLYDAVLGIDCCSALFSSNLWMLLSSHQYTLSTVTTLCKAYEKLETNNLFHNSPQEVHLANTIAGLFENLPNEDKVMFCKQIEIKSENSLLSILKIKNLPISIRTNVEDSVLEKLLVGLNKLSTADLNVQDMKQLTDIIRISATCTFKEPNFSLEEYITNAWLKACPRLFLEFPRNIDSGIYWYYAFVEALASLTSVTIDKFNDFDNAVKWTIVANYSFIHKCVEIHQYDDDSTSKKKTQSHSNFELDIDNLFEGESESDEPASKKAKMDDSEAEVIIKRLEHDSYSLSQCGEITDELKKRIAAVCGTLRNII
ncbi:unnamed protein product, partial [Iphiclides podalirius]